MGHLNEKEKPSCPVLILLLVSLEFSYSQNSVTCSSDFRGWVERGLFPVTKILIFLSDSTSNRDSLFISHKCINILLITKASAYSLNCGENFAFIT